MTKRAPVAARNAGALPERIGALVELYGLEAMAGALALWCEREAAQSRGLRRELVLRDTAETLRDIGARAREELDEGLASTTERLIGRRFRLSPEGRAAIAGGEHAVSAIVRAVRKGGIRRALGSPPLASDEDLRAAGGLTQFDLLEVDVCDERGRRLGRDAVPPCALERLASYRASG